jgi:hypothetical protein
MNEWNNKTIAESVWQMISTVGSVANQPTFLTHGEPSGVIFDAVEDLVAFATRNPDVMPAWLHERYTEFLRNKGFSKGDVTDSASKKSSALVDWGDASPVKRAEYAILLGVLKIVVRGPEKKLTKRGRPLGRRSQKKSDGSEANGLAEGMLSDGDSVVI